MVTALVDYSLQGESERAMGVNGRDLCVNYSI